jgi:hypothetical protein
MLKGVKKVEQNLSSVFGFNFAQLFLKVDLKVDL